MTRKDHEKIAAAIRAARPTVTPEKAAYCYAQNVGIDKAANHLADMLAADNPRFDRSRFLAACGLGE